MNLEFLRQIFKKFSDIKFHENPSSGSRVIPMQKDGQTDRRDKANGCFLQFCAHA